MFRNIQKAAVKTFVRFSIEILMVLESAGGCCEYIINVLAYPEGCGEHICTFFSMEISMVLESAGGCCESIINVLESPEGCCEDSCTFCLGNINGFGISRRLL